mmetsp:Transcript_45964/g.98498  ORF Transcript_45964/g.98498 Transcript_45964/m.98498 type:complete len:210 (+) Transcript_45964:2435-3064(+)
MRLLPFRIFYGSTRSLAPVSLKMLSWTSKRALSWWEPRSLSSGSFVVGPLAPSHCFPSGEVQEAASPSRRGPAPPRSSRCLCLARSAGTFSKTTAATTTTAATMMMRTRLMVVVAAAMLERKRRPRRSTMVSGRGRMQASGYGTPLLSRQADMSSSVTSLHSWQTAWVWKEEKALRRTQGLHPSLPPRPPPPLPTVATLLSPRSVRSPP